VEVVAEKLPDVNALDEAGNTALHIAIRNESSEIPQMLIEGGGAGNEISNLQYLHNIDCNKQDLLGRTGNSQQRLTANKHHCQQLFTGLVCL
jgi:ankyrin repeat protein